MSPSSAAPKKVDVTLTVTKFCDILAGRLRKGSLAGHAIAVAKNKSNVVLKTGFYQLNVKGTIRVPRPGAILRFNIKAQKKGTTYRPVGIAFARADKTRPMGVHWSTNRTIGRHTPFSGFQTDGRTMQITDLPLKRGNQHASPKNYTTYKFSVYIQRESDGRIGVIDPYIENQN